MAFHHWWVCQFLSCTFVMCLWLTVLYSLSQCYFSVMLAARNLLYCRVIAWGNARHSFKQHIQYSTTQIPHNTACTWKAWACLTRVLLTSVSPWTVNPFSRFLQLKYVNLWTFAHSQVSSIGHMYASCISVLSFILMFMFLFHIYSYSYLFLVCEDLFGKTKWKRWQRFWYSKQVVINIMNYHTFYSICFQDIN